MENTADVVVIGAGPTGVMMAAEVARHGLRCRIIDKGTRYGDESRAVAIQPRTMEIFDHLGLAEAFLAEGIRVRAANPISHFRRLARVSFDSLKSPYPFILSLEQAKTERLLNRYAFSLGIEVEQGVEFLHLEENAEEVEVVVRHLASDKEERIRSSWVVGCDGAHSPIRRQLNLSFESFCGCFFDRRCACSLAAPP